MQRWQCSSYPHCCSLQVQQNIEFLIEECLRRGAHPDDRDSLTDMSLLMYACKAGADGVGNVESAARVGHVLVAQVISG